MHTRREFCPALSVSLHLVSTDVNEELIDLVESSRIDSLEVSLNHFSGEGIARLQQAARSGRIDVGSIHARHGSDCVIATRDANRRQATVAEYRRAIDLARECDAGIVVLHAGSAVPDGNREEMISHAREALRELSAMSDASRVKLAVEYLPRTCIGNTPEELFGMLEGIDKDRVGVCLDVNHLMDRAEQLPEIVRSLRGRIFEIHVSDYDGVDERHWLPGRGVIDWKGLVEPLVDVDYSGVFNYEACLPGEQVRDRIAAVVGNFDWLCGLHESVRASTPR